MLLSEFYDHLSFGELSQYDIGTSDTGRISDRDYPRINSFLNLALTRLHTRLPLRSASLQLRISPDLRTYALRSTNGQAKKPDTATDDRTFYILDQDNPFDDNILVVNYIEDENGDEFDIGDERGCKGVFIRSQTLVEFDKPTDQTVIIRYLQNHPRMPLSRKFDPEQVEIDVPEFCIEPLLAFVAGKVIGSGGNGESMQEGQAKLNSFEAQLMQVEQSGVVREPTTTNNRELAHGWV